MVFLLLLSLYCVTVAATVTISAHNAVFAVADIVFGAAVAVVAGIVAVVTANAAVSATAA